MTKLKILFIGIITLAVALPALADGGTGFFVSLEGYYAQPSINEVWGETHATPGAVRGGTQHDLDFDYDVIPAITFGFHTAEAGTFSVHAWTYSDTLDKKISTGVNNIEHPFFKNSSQYAQMKGSADLDFDLVDLLWSGTFSERKHNYFGGGVGLRYYSYDLNKKQNFVNAAATATGNLRTHAEGDGVGLLGTFYGGYRANDIFSVNGRTTMGAVQADLSATTKGMDGLTGEIIRIKGSKTNVPIQWSARLSFDFAFKSGFGFGFGYEASSFGGVGMDANGKGSEDLDFAGAFLNFGWNFLK